MSRKQLLPALTLRKRATRSFPLAMGEIAQVEVAAGLCWITIEGDPEDYVVSQAETLLLEGPGLVVVQGLDPANEFNVLRLAALETSKDRGESLSAARLLVKC